ncbi:MAG: Cation efflux system protein CusB [Verrucomicrobiae bacterium]|nr:Cation efflux system protein CusB [Verrucomicrobiae bacterium]
MKQIIALIVAAGLVLVAGCGRNASSPDDHDGHQHGAGEKHEEHAAAKKDAHGHAEHEGEESHAGEEGVVKLSPAAVAASKIKTVEVRTGSGWVRSQFVGRLDYNKDITAIVSAPMEGRLQKWLVNIGDKVRVGDVLAHVQNPQNLDTPILLKSPLDGEVLERKSALGTWVKPEDTLFIVGDPSSLWVIAEVREEMLAKIIKDAPAQIRVLALPDETLEGRYLRSSAAVETEMRTVEYDYAVANRDRQLRAGMFAYVSLATARVENKLLVPDEAVQTVRGKPTAFIAEEPGHYRVAELTLGEKIDGQWEVQAGLPNPAQVVTTGSFILKSEYLKAEMGEGHAH